MKSQKSHYRQVSYHAYSTHLQTSNQANGNQTNKKGTSNFKTKKTIQKLKITKNICRKGTCLPSHLNITMSLMKVREPQPTTKHNKANKTQIYTN